MNVNDIAACNLMQLQSTAPWLCMMVALVYGWTRHAMSYHKRLADARIEERTETGKAIAKEYKKQLEALEKDHAADLRMMREAKGVVWIHFDERGEPYVCPGCGLQQKQRKAGSN